MKKLKLSLWQDILYLVFVMLVPVVIASVELFSSGSSSFKITFSSLGSILISLIVIKKFVFNTKIEALREKNVLLEHDYSIDVGNKEKTKKIWATNNLIIYAYNAIITVLSLLLSWLFITALSEQLIQFRGAATIILGSCLLGTVFKLCCYWFIIRGVNDVETSGENKRTEIN